MEKVEGMTIYGGLCRAAERVCLTVCGRYGSCWKAAMRRPLPLQVQRAVCA